MQISLPPFSLDAVLRVRRLYSLHYFQFATGYVFPGERHAFWEMVYIDRGEADIGAGRQVYRLSQGQVIFHKPNEFHSIWANYAAAPNILVLSFSAPAQAMRPFEGYRGSLSLSLRRLLQSILFEGRALFGPELPQEDGLSALPQAPAGTRQLLGNYLEQFLLLLLRDMGSPARGLPSPPVPRGGPALAAMDTALALMRAHPDGSLGFEDFCRASGLGQTALKKAFQTYGGSGVMAHYRRVRLEEARRLLREGSLNITQVAEHLGYPSIHAFSRQFTREVGITPSGYLRTVRP